MKPDTYDEVVAQRDAARAAVKAWEDKEASRGMCCWQMEQERDAAIAAQIAAQVEVGKWRSDFDAARAEAARLKGALCEAADALQEAQRCRNNQTYNHRNLSADCDCYACCGLDNALLGLAQAKASLEGER